MGKRRSENCKLGMLVKMAHAEMFPHLPRNTISIQIMCRSILDEKDVEFQVGKSLRKQTLKAIGINPLTKKPIREKKANTKRKKRMDVKTSQGFDVIDDGDDFRRVCADYAGSSV